MGIEFYLSSHSTGCMGSISNRAIMCGIKTKNVHTQKKVIETGTIAISIDKGTIAILAFYFSYDRHFPSNKKTEIWGENFQKNTKQKMAVSLTFPEIDGKIINFWLVKTVGLPCIERSLLLFIWDILILYKQDFIFYLSQLKWSTTRYTEI